MFPALLVHYKKKINIFFFKILDNMDKDGKEVELEDEDEE